MALISSNTFLGWNVKKGVLLASPGEGSLTQHHTMCWSVIRMEGESCCQHKLWGHLLYGIKGSREGPAVSLGLVVCASCYLGPDPKCSLLLQCFPPQLCSNQSLGSVSQVTRWFCNLWAFSTISILKPHMSVMLERSIQHLTAAELEWLHHQLPLAACVWYLHWTLYHFLWIWIVPI